MGAGWRHPGESPARVLGKVRRELERGWAPGLTVLTGDDLYHLDAAQRALLDHLIPESDREFALTVFGHERVDVAKVVAAARSVGMFTPRRVVLVSNVESLEGKPDAVVAYAKSPPPGSYLLVRAPRLDQRFKVPKALAQHGRRLTFHKESGPTPELRREVRQLAAERGLKLAAQAVDLLLVLADADLHRVSTELDKLAAWLGEGSARPVTPETVRELAAGSGSLTGWEVSEALLDGDVPGALAAVRRLVAEPGEALMLLGALAFTARSLIQARLLRERRVPAREILRVTRAWGLKERLFPAASRADLGKLLSFPARLLEADRTLKSRAIAPGAVMESLILDLMEAAPAEARRTEGV